jgi:hypothetical protein
MKRNTSLFTPRGLAPRALAAASAACLATLLPAPAGASASPSVIRANLNDVACTAATSCMAVGTFLGRIQGTSAFQNFTLAESWNGSTWTVLPSPSPSLPGGGAILTSISCTSSTNCMAVGETQVFHEPGGNLIDHPLAESWNGTAWTELPTPVFKNSGASLNGVSCTSPSRCMAVGNEGTPKNPTLFTLAESWNGTAWRFVHTPFPLTPGGTALNRIACTSATTCMAVGYYGFNAGFGTSVTLSEAWDGVNWHRRPTPTPGSSGSLAGVACLAATDCMAVGGRAEHSPTILNGTLSERWNGTRWITLPSPNPRVASDAGFGAISCTGRAACMATGLALDQTGETGFTLAEAWNGTTWSLLRTPSPGSFSGDLSGVSCTATTTCMAVGEVTGTGNEHTLAEAWNGTRWSVVPTPHP